DELSVGRWSAQVWQSYLSCCRSCMIKQLKTKDPPSVHILTDRGRAGAIDLQIGRTSQQINKGPARPVALPCFRGVLTNHRSCRNNRRSLGALLNASTLQGSVHSLSGGAVVVVTMY